MRPTDPKALPCRSRSARSGAGRPLRRGLWVHRRIREQDQYAGAVELISVASAGQVQRNIGHRPSPAYEIDAGSMTAMGDKSRWSSMNRKASGNAAEPLIDCFDAMVVSWSMGTRPNVESDNTMLDTAIDKVTASGGPQQTHEI